MDKQLTHVEIEDLATIFADAAEACQVLEAAGLSRARQPLRESCGDSLTFWTEIARRFEAGVLENGPDRLRADVRRRLPANRAIGKGRRADRIGSASRTSERSPLDLGVQRAPYLHSNAETEATSPTIEPLTVYVERAHDRKLRERLHRARAGDAVLVLLVGGSCTGKTRALYEAVCACLPEWPMQVSIQGCEVVAR